MIQMDKIKYGLLRAIDLSGLGFLSPVVRLCTGEDPAKQTRDIARFIFLPILAFLVFLWIWSVIAPKHKTKAGEVPTPSVVWDAGKGIWSFHQREAAKEKGFLTSAENRLAKLQQATRRLAEVEKLEATAKKQVEEVIVASQDKFDAVVAPAKRAYEAKREEYREHRIESAAALKEEAASLMDASPARREAFLGKVRATNRISEAIKEELDQLKAEYEEAKEITFPEVKDAVKAATLLGEEKQFLVKYISMLGDNSREVKLEEAKSALEDAQEEFRTADSGDFYKLAASIISKEELRDTLASSKYAKPWTLPKQIVRSILCAFTGFFIATLIAIPIGILCGLSPSFMAAVTPFIALFKPVSPLVWLPIVMIIVGGFMPEPDKHWLIVFMGKIPFIKDYQIDPMFLSSAITVALCSLWATLVNTALGVGSVDKDHMNVARILRLGFAARLFKIVIPTALPLIFAGLRISLGVGWMVLVAAEILSTSEGIGKFVNDMYTNGSSESFAQMFVVVFIVGFIGMVLDRIMVFLQRLVSFDTAPAL